MAHSLSRRGEFPGPAPAAVCVSRAAFPEWRQRHGGLCAGTMREHAVSMRSRMREPRGGSSLSGGSGAMACVRARCESTPSACDHACVPRGGSSAGNAYFFMYFEY